MGTSICRVLLRCAVLACCSLVLPSVDALAADAVAPVTGAAPNSDGATAAEGTPGKIAFPNLLDGALSAGGDLDEEERTTTGLFRRPTAMDPWFAWKRDLRRDYGLNIGGSIMVLWQNYSSSRIGENNSVGGKFTLNLSYDLLNRGDPNALSFDMAVEQRGPLGTDLAPLQAGIGAGSFVPTAATYGKFDMGITQAYIRQSLDDNRFQYTIGKVFAPNYVDAYPFFDDNRQFLSQAFSTNPTMWSPLRGFGAVAVAFPTDTGLYLQGGVFTNNSSNVGSTYHDFFTVNERFYTLEVGLSGLAGKGVAIQSRGPTDANNIHLTGWYRDPAEDGSEPRSYGVAFNANQKVGDNIMWFLRAGWSEGYLADRAVAAGFGWRPLKDYSDLFGFGIGWTHPASPFLESQYTAEAFYRFHVTPNFAITPDIQLQLHPALNPAENALWVFSLRARLAF
jgi:porin